MPTLELKLSGSANAQPISYFSANLPKMHFQWFYNISRGRSHGPAIVNLMQFKRNVVSISFSLVPLSTAGH